MNFFLTYLSNTYFLISPKDELTLGLLNDDFESYREEDIKGNCFSQYWFKTELPIFMFSTQSLFQVSSFVDLTLVMDGPRALCAPEQFIHTKTPKSSETPKLE